MKWFERSVFVLFVLFFLAMIYGAMREGELKDAFDVKCKDNGGVPLRSTYLYDAKENKIHYVCLKPTSIMNVD